MRAALAAVLAVLAVLLGSAAAQPKARPAPAASDVAPVRHVSPGFARGYSLARSARAAARVAAFRPQARRIRSAVIGERRLWPALDQAARRLYLKNFMLRAIGAHIEIWVANDADAVSKDLEYPAGDCRNDERVQVTDAQLQYMVAQFDGVIYPRSSQAFSVPPSRDGSKARLPDLVGLPADYYLGDGDRLIVLVDNIRDENFYDRNNASNLSYVAGVFVEDFNELTDRNVMTIDGLDWLHRTGAAPPDEPVPGDLCRSKPARPFTYEATFAHEYQHLLEHYQDDDEVPWVNEGLSMYAETLAGYTSLRTPITQSGFSAQTQCFLGYQVIRTPANPNPPLRGGPENSLTLWGDQGDGEILCDYGAAETFMNFLAARYGPSFLSRLHRDKDNGLASLRKLLRSAAPADVGEIVHDWAAMVALDGVLDRGARLAGGTAKRYRSAPLDASINWAGPDAYSTGGAPPNGSDYVRLRNEDGAFIESRRIREIAFDGAERLPPRPVEWRVDGNPPGHPGDAAFYSGSGAFLDRAIVRQVTVPAADPVLRFDTLFDIDASFDFGFVQVSTDGGKTWKSLGNEITVSGTGADAIETVKRNVPGLTGKSGRGATAVWLTTAFDLSPYRGRKVLLAFRYVTDGFSDGPGWWIDNVRVGSQALSDGLNLSAWRTPTFFNPIRVSGFTVQLVGYTTRGPRRAFVHRLELDRRFDGKLAGPELARVLGPGYGVVAAIVTYDEPTERIDLYAPYKLLVNGVLQPGGRFGT